MSEEILNNSFQSKISNFIKKNFKNLIILLFFLISVLFSVFIYKDVQKKK